MKKILVVDDQMQLRELIEVALQGEGRQILHADSGDEAVNVALRELPDVVLLDIMMPGGIDGLEVARRLRTSEETRSCAILAVTARSRQLDRLRANDAGFDGYLTKPFSVTTLRHTVEKLLCGH